MKMVEPRFVRTCKKYLRAAEPINRQRSLPIAKQYGRLLQIVKIKDNLFIYLIFFITVILFLFVEIVNFLILELSNIEKKESL